MISPAARPWWVYGIGATALLAALCFFALITGWPTTPDDCVGSGCYCERFSLADVQAGARGIRQPVNTWSNLYALITAGIVAYFLSRDRAVRVETNPMRSSAPIADAYVFAVLFLGLGSMWLHASISKAVSWMDGFSMYVFAGFLVFYTLDRVLRAKAASGLLRGLIFWIGWPVVAVALTIVGAHGVDSLILIIILVAIYAVLEFLVAGWIPGWTARGFWIAGAVAMAAAVIFWLLSKTGKPLCNPDSWFQPHGLLWHTLAGVMALMMFFYWRLEPPRAGAAGGAAGGTVQWT